LNTNLARRTDIDELLADLTCQAVRAIRAETGILSLYDKITDELYYHRKCVSTGESGEYGMQEGVFSRSKRGEGIIGWCAEHRTSVNVTNPDDDNRFRRDPDREDETHIHSVLAVPLIFREELHGVLVAQNKRNQDAFSKDDEKLIGTLAAHATLLISNYRLAEEQLNRDRLTDLGQSIINSAHGLKNILNNMDGGTYIVETGVSRKNMDTVYDGWDIIKRNSHRLRELVLDMLLYSRPRTPEYQETDITQLCSDLIELVSEKARSQQVEVVLEADPDIGTVYIDPKGIHRCILNLTSNAIHACQQKNGGQVKIQLSKKDDESLEIRVSDNGKGISKDNLEHIFDVFFTTKGSKGTGLGLPVTRKIISEHHGTLEVTSEIGAGTTFTITLPRATTGVVSFSTVSGSPSPAEDSFP